MRPILIAVFAAMALASSASAHEPDHACEAALNRFVDALLTQTEGTPNETKVREGLEAAGGRDKYVESRGDALASIGVPCAFFLTVPDSSIQAFTESIINERAAAPAPPRAKPDAPNDTPADSGPDDPGSVLDQVQKQQADEGRLTTILRNVERLKDATPDP